MKMEELNIPIMYPTGVPVILFILFGFTIFHLLFWARSSLRFAFSSESRSVEIATYALDLGLSFPSG